MQRAHRLPLMDGQLWGRKKPRRPATILQVKNDFPEPRRRWATECRTSLDLKFPQDFCRTLFALQTNLSSGSKQINTFKLQQTSDGDGYIE